MIPDDSNVHNPSGHLRTLGICWVLYGVIRWIAAVWLVLFSGTATLMFGALLNRVGDPFTLMSTFHLIYGLLVVMSVVRGILSVVAGLTLLAGAPSGHILTIVAAFLSVSSIPLGTTLGIYSLIILLSGNLRHTSATVPRVPIPDLKREPIAM